MFRKYEKTYRILVPQIGTKGKHYLSDADVKRLLGGTVSVQEKLDGANVGIIRHKDSFHIQKRGSLVGESEHDQFNLFKAWVYENYEKVMAIPEGTILYGELMFCKHTVFYDKLPDYFVAFAWCDRDTNEYYSRDEMVELCDRIGISYVPEIARGVFNKTELFDLIPKTSNFGSEPAEGIVVWNQKNGMRGKVVREEFQKAMDRTGHWMRQKIKINQLEKKNE